MKLISNSDVYKLLTIHIDKNLLSKCIKDSIIDTKSNKVFIVGLDTIERSTRATTKKGLEELDKGEICLLFDQEGTLNTFPIIPTGNGKVYVQVTSIMSKEEYLKDGEVNVKYHIKNAEAFEEALAVALAVKQVSKNTSSIKGELRKNLMELYIQLVLGILNKGTSLSTNKDNVKVVRYILANFFHYGILGLDKNNNIDDYIKRFSEIKDTAEVRNKVAAVDVIAKGEIKNIDELVECLNSLIPLKSVDKVYLVRNAAIMYTSPAAIALDYIPYLAGVAIACVTKYSFIAKNLKNNNNVKKFAVLAGTEIINMIK